MISPLVALSLVTCLCAGYHFARWSGRREALQKQLDEAAYQRNDARESARMHERYARTLESRLRLQEEELELLRRELRDGVEHRLSMQSALCDQRETIGLENIALRKRVHQLERNLAKPKGNAE